MFPTAYYLQLCDLLRQDGLESAELFRQAGWPAGMLESAPRYLKDEQVEQLLSASRAISGRSDLAFRLARHLNLSTHGMLGFAILNSPNIDYALRFSARYFSLFLPAFNMHYRLDSQSAEIKVFPNRPLSPICLQFHLELVAASLHWKIQELSQNQLPDYDLFLSYTEPEHLERYRELEPARCHFSWAGGHGIGLVLPSQLSRLPLHLADSMALADAEASCRRALSKAQNRGAFSDIVRTMLRESRGESPSRKEVARHLNLSLRSLDRYLQQEGLSFRQLQDQAFLKKAQRLLDTTQLSITEISQELGFRDLPNFSRSFKRLAKMSPAQWRARKPPG